MAIPLLIVALFLHRHKQVLLLGAGTSAYFLVTYLFYTAMGMYNTLFLVYAVCWDCLSFLLACIGRNLAPLYLLTITANRHHKHSGPGFS